MLQQILKEMYIDPDVLEALNEEQKRILFLKMRQEQVRRWTEREENFEKQRERLNSPKPKQAFPKSVSWLLGNDGDVHVCVIGEAAGSKPYDLIHSQVDDKRETNNHNARFKNNCQNLRLYRIIAKCDPKDHRNLDESDTSSVQTGLVSDQGSDSVHHVVSQGRHEQCVRVPMFLNEDL
ncbi:UNVERIFIED_CONTAM: hypothetical protein FKN15_066737 [Acipenser sinensis]